MLLIAILLLILASVVLIAQVFLPFLAEFFARFHKQTTQRTSRSLEEMFIWRPDKRLVLIFRLSPIIFGIATFILSHNPALAFAGAVIGFILPQVVIIKLMEKVRKKKFQSQILDALTSISQSLKAGLSFVQALEVLVEEMPAPISQEFSLIVKGHKMGIPLEESFERLNNKMGLEDLNLVTTAILLGRETGGNLTDVFSNLSDSIRQTNKINEQVRTLTTQARWQGVIMSLLPIIFAAVIFNINPSFFEIMLESDTGRLLLLWCVISEVIGTVMLRRLSHIEV